MKTYKQYIEGVRAVGKPVSPTDLFQDLKTIDGDVNPLRRTLKHIRYKKYLDTYGIG